MEHPGEPAPSAVPETIDSLRQGISVAKLRAAEYLLNTFKPLDSEGMPDGPGGWSQFLEELDKPPSITGTAHALISLMACGESAGVSQIASARALIVQGGRLDGAWSKPDLKATCGLVRITYLALRALIDIGEPLTANHVRLGVQWMLAAQNPDGGWGNLATDLRSDVTSTSYVIRVLRDVVNTEVGVRPAIASGRGWLVRSRNVAGGWGQFPEAPATLSHTAEAVEGLLAAGAAPHELEGSQQWLLEQLRDPAPFSERYVISLSGLAPSSIMWTHLPREQAALAILKCGTSVSSPVLRQAIGAILAQQDIRGYWRCETFPDGQPVWATKEALLALREFDEASKREGTSVELRRAMDNVTGQLATQNERIAYLEAQLAQRSWRRRLRMWWAVLKRPGVYFAVTAVVLSAVYVYLRKTTELTDVADMYVAILGIVGLVVGVFHLIELRRRHE